MLANDDVTLPEEPNFNIKYCLVDLYEKHERLIGVLDKERDKYSKKLANKKRLMDEKNPSTKGYLIQKERYEVGVGTLVELSRSTWTLVDGAASRAQARYQLLFQKVILDYYTGLLNPEEI